MANAMITGGSAGLGRALAPNSCRGFTVTITARHGSAGHGRDGARRLPAPRRRRHRSDHRAGLVELAAAPGRSTC